MTRSTSLSTILVAAGLTLAGIAFSAGPASAVSAPIPYSCTFDVAGARGTGSATATWDSAIPDGGTSTPAWTPVPLDPYTGTVTVPDGFVAALRTEGVTELVGGGSHEVHWDLVGAPELVELRYPATGVPASGPMTIGLTGVDAGSFSHSDAETYLLIADDFSLSSDDGTVTMSCATTDSREVTRVIDSVTVTLGPAPTSPAPTTTATTGPTSSVSPSVSASPVRPTLVQTDQPRSGTGALPVLGLGLGAVALGGGLVAARTVRGRRH